MEGYNNIYTCADFVAWQRFEGRSLAGLLASAAASKAKIQSFFVKV